MIGVALAMVAQLSAGLDASQPASSRPADAELRLTLMSFNIRLGVADDGPNSWKFRREIVFDVLSKHRPGIVGMQEAYKFQLDEILAARPEYAAIGVGREDGKSKGEYSPVVYRRDRLSPLEHDTFWLSQTPEVPGSKSWETGCTRVCTWVRFRDTSTGRTFYHFNTHLDNASQQARVRGIDLILKRIEERKHPDPVFLTGDFNAEQDNPAIQKVKQTKLRDTFRLSHPDATVVGTFHGWKSNKDGRRIDYIFVPENIRVLTAEIVHDNHDGRYPSDHFPVIAAVSWE